MTRFAFTSGTCVAVVNQPVSWETVSFDVLIAQRRYAGVTRCQSQQRGVSDFHSYAPSVDELARPRSRCRYATAIRVMNTLPRKTEWESNN